MNDYPDLSHPAIDAMMRAGDPAQAAEWAERARLLGRRRRAANGDRDGARHLVGRDRVEQNGCRADRGRRSA
jgi:hypothetical protein